MPEYLGQYKLTVTDKNRLVIPAKLRENLVAEEESVYVACHNPGWLEIYDSNYWSNLTSHLQQLSLLHSDLQDYRRLLYSQVQASQLDQQGRLVLSEQMLECLKIADTIPAKSTELVVIGSGSFIEIWTAQLWEIKKKALSSGFTALGDRLAFMLDKRV